MLTINAEPNSHRRLFLAECINSDVKTAIPSGVERLERGEVSLITLVRGRDTVTLKADVWGTLQELAKQEGWRRLGAFDAPGRSARAVMARDVRGLAKVLERLVNSDKAADGGRADLAAPAAGELPSRRRIQDPVAAFRVHRV